MPTSTFYGVFIRALEAAASPCVLNYRDPGREGALSPEVPPGSLEKDSRGSSQQLGGTRVEIDGREA